MMQRALSAEHLADFASQAVKGLKRLVSSSNFLDPKDMTPQQQDLVSTSKQIDEAWNKKQAKVDVTTVELWARSLVEELEQLTQTNASAHQSSPSSGPSANISEVSSPSSPKVPSSANLGALGARKPLNDAVLLHAIETTKIVFRSYGGQALDTLSGIPLLEKLLRAYSSCQSLPRKTLEALQGILCDVMGDLPGALRECMPAFYAILQSRDDVEIQSAQHLRVMQLFIAALRKSDVTQQSAHLPHQPTKVCGREIASLMLSQLRELLKAFESDLAKQSRIMTTTVLCWVSLLCVVRGNAELKQLVLDQRDCKELWTFAVSQLYKMDTIVTYHVVLSNGKLEERAMSLDNHQVWAAELAELLIELCTSDSFSLRRQCLYGETVMPPTPPSIRGGVSSRHAATATSAPPSRRWEVVPPGWDATLSSGAVTVWRFAALLSECTIDATSVRPLLSYIGSLDTSTNPASDFVFRVVLSSVLLLCNATPRNIEILSRAGSFDIVVELLTDSGITAFPRRNEGPLRLDEDEGRSATSSTSGCVTGNRHSEASRQLLLSLLTVFASLHLKSQDLSTLMCAVESMRQHETTQEDCEVIEHLLTAIGHTTYPIKGTVFFGGDAFVVCPLEKFVGRWYGYTFLAWINPSCVWGDGCALYSYAEPSTPSAVVVYIVANGRARSLAVRTYNNKDFTIALLPDTPISADGWTHLAIVHNFSGFSVYVNGRKTNNNVSVAFPREPPKPHRLLFGIGSDCSGYINPSAGGVDVSGHNRAVDSPSRVPSLYGFGTGIEFLDGSLGEKELEKIVSFGPHQCSTTTDVAHTLPVLVSLANVDGQLDVSGTIVKKDNQNLKASGVTTYEAPNVPETFVSLGVVSWTTDVIKSIDPSSTNRNTIAVLCTEFMSAAFKLASRDELGKYEEMGVIDEARKVFLTWGSSVPPQLSNSLLSIAIPRGGNNKQLRAHSTTSAILNAVLDLLSVREAGPIFYSQTLKDMSELLSVAENAKIFRESSSRFTTLLLLSRWLPHESVDDFVALVEKLCKETTEIEALLRFIAFQEPSRHSELIACELLRMLYDVARPSTWVCDLVAGAFSGYGLWWLVFLVHGQRHRSESIRICATKLLALVLHCSKKAKDVFVKGGGFDTLAAAVVPQISPPPLAAPVTASHPSEKDAVTSTGHSAALGSAPSLAVGTQASMTVRLMTYNCFFKFALDFYTPNSDPSSSSLHGSSSVPVQQSGRHVDPRNSGGALFGFHGHLPGVLPIRTARRGQSIDLGYGSECGDVEVRLSVDDNYSSQSASKDSLVYPQGIQLVLLLLGRSIKQHLAEHCGASPASNSEEHSRDGLMSDEHQSVTTVNSKREDELDTIAKVLGFLDRIVDLTPNASALVVFPWLEWLWGAVEPVFSYANTTGNITSLVTAIETPVRSIIRKVCVVDLSRQVKGSTLRRIRDMVDEPLLQQIVLEEIVRHFSESSRLDTMDMAEATNCIRNLDSLLLGIDEAVVPFPCSLAVEIVFALRAIAVNNNNWVRQKMKSSTKLFETRDRLAFLLMTTIKEFSKEKPEFLFNLVEVNMQDVNTLYVVLKGIVDAVQSRNLEEVETLQGMLHRLYDSDEEQRKSLQKLVDADTIELLLQQPQRGSGDEANASSQDLISWCMANDGKWDTVAQRILKAYRPVESEVRSMADRREKERSARSKVRKNEVEKKIAASGKGFQDFEKMKLDIEAKGFQQYLDLINEADDARSARDAVVCS